VTQDAELARTSQRLVDVINLEKGRLETIGLPDLLTDEWLPGLDAAVSWFEGGVLRRPVGAIVPAEPGDMLITFDRWACDTRHPADLRWVLKTLEEAYGQPVDIEYAFDGAWFTVAKHKLKQMTRYQAAAEGERVNPLKLGRGPFPLPLGQKAEEVIRHFHVTTRPPRASDPNHTDYLYLRTRDRYVDQMAFRSVQMWVDRKTNLPAKIRSRDKSRKRITVTFSDLATGVKLSDEVFHIPRPSSRAGWSYEVKRLETKKPARPSGGR
jgi:hypothetical protein